MPDLPVRKVRDPVVLRAMAHRLRIKLYKELMRDGPATAADLAARTGETQANCSWHLRQMHRYGFIEEAPHVKGRSRPWQVVKQLINLDLFGDHQPSSVPHLANEALWDVLVDQQLETVREWRATGHQEDKAWRDAAAIVSEQYIWLTADELEAFTNDLQDAVRRHIEPTYDRLDPANRPAGVRTVRFMSWAVPAPQETD